MTSIGCQRSFENAFQGKTPHYRTYGKELLSLWQQRGYPSLEDWPPQEVGWDLLDYLLGAIGATLNLADS